MVETSQQDEVSGVPQPGGRPVAGVSYREAQRRPLVVQARDDPLRRRTRANIRVSLHVALAGRARPSSHLDRETANSRLDERIYRWTF